MWVWWGPHLVNFYNDAYLPILGGKHPHALGRPAREVWAEIWDQIGGRIDDAMAGESTYSEAELLVMQRNGYPEETYYTFSFSPMPEDDGLIGGIICANSDETDRVIGARRLALLRELASRTWEAKSVADVFTLSARALASDARDMPFALLYGFEEDGARAILRGSAGIEAGHPAAPESIALDGASPWPVSEVVRGRAAAPGFAIGREIRRTAPGPWDDAPNEACCCRCRPAPRPRLAGF